MDLGFNLAQSNQDLKDPTSRQIFGDTSGLICKNDLIPCLSVFPLQLCHLTLATSLLQFNQLMQPVLSFVSRWSFFSSSLNVFSTEQSVVVLLFVRFQRWAEIASHAVEMHPLIR